MHTGGGKLSMCRGLVRLSREKDTRIDRGKIHCPHPLAHAREASSSVKLFCLPRADLAGGNMPVTVLASTVGLRYSRLPEYPHHDAM